MLTRIAAVLTVLLFSLKAAANPACVVCTVAIGAALPLARKLGVDDCVVGVWIGALLAILGYWLIRFADKKRWFFAGRNTLLMALSIGSIGFIYAGEMAYMPIPIGFFFIDAFLFAALLGALTFICSMQLYERMKARNGGHAHFPFEKVVIPVGSVLLISLLLNYYPVCNCHS